MIRLLNALVALLLTFTAFTSASAQTTIFTFPDPAITNFRLTTATLNYNGGTQPWIRVAADLHTGDVVSISGQADLDGGYLRLIGCGAASSMTIDGGPDPFSDSITCTAAGSYVQIMGQSNFTVGHINSLTIIVTPAG